MEKMERPPLFGLSFRHHARLDWRALEPAYDQLQKLVRDIIKAVLARVIPLGRGIQRTYDEPICELDINVGSYLTSFARCVQQLKPELSIFIALLGVASANICRHLAKDATRRQRVILIVDNS